MSKAKSLLAEAIADAKALKQIAFENAKAAMNETFAPALKNMIDASIREELDEEYEEKSSEDMDESKYGKSEEDGKPMDEKKKKSSEEEKSSEEGEDSDTELNLDELLAELEEEDQEYGKSEEDGKPMDEKKFKSSEDGKSSEDMEENKEEELDAPPSHNDDKEYEVYLKLKKKFEPEMKEAASSEEASDENPGEEESDYDVDEDSVEAIIRELEAGEKEDTVEEKKEDKKKSSEETLDEKKEPKKSSEEDKKKSSEEKITAEYASLRKELNETNLLNAKLLYFSRLIKENDNISKSQKLGFLKQLDKATTVKEAKLIHETISESLKTSKSSVAKTKKQIKESTGLASKAAGNSTAKKTDKSEILNENSMVTRFQILAGLKKID